MLKEAVPAGLHELVRKDVGAATQWIEYGSVVEQAYALLGVARYRLATGRSAAAEQPAREARTLFAKLAARPLLAEADELLGRATAVGEAL